MLNFNLFENIDFVFNCFGKKITKNETLDEDELDQNIYNNKISKKFKISILPITPNFDIENLYPLTDHVELWNIFVVGNDKTYILANVNDPFITLPQACKLPNKLSDHILPTELNIVFDSIWNKTLVGKQLQFYMVWNGKLYFINTYPFHNGKKKVIGAILFMRGFDTAENKIINENAVRNRYSEEINSKLDSVSDSKNGTATTRRTLSDIMKNIVE
jgi:hypothetical protein